MKSELTVASVKPAPLGQGLATDFDYVPAVGDAWLPRIALAQGLSAAVLSGEVKPGSFILPDGTSCAEVTVRVLGVRRVRTLWSDGEDRRVLCRSANGLVGEGEPGGNCEECPLSQWTTEKQRRVPPRCTLSFQYLVQYSADGGQTGLAVFTASTRSASAFIGQVNTYVVAYGLDRFTVRVKSSLVAKGKKQYYVPTVAGVRADSPPSVTVVEEDEDVPF